MKSIKFIILTVILFAVSTGSVSAQQNGSLGGTVTDALGAIVVGATITTVSSTGAEKSAVSNSRGEFTIAGLAPGTYTVKAIAPAFALYENNEVVVEAAQRNELFVILTVAGVEETVEVSSDNAISTDADATAGATVIKGADLESLPDDPDELAAALQALAGPSAGPNGGQIYIDGFTGGQLPPKESIREIRINQNPFSAEFDRLGFGRIEILTKPGSDKFRGSVSANFNDESLNSRNPFASNKAASQMRAFSGNLSGPIQKGRSSFFLDVNNRDVDSNTIVNAVILDPALNITNFSEDFRVPTRRFSIGPRFDYAINDKNTIVARYRFDRSSTQNQGIGDTSLPSRAYETTSYGHEFRLTETMIINAKTINETRFEYSFDKRQQNGDNTIPTISVPSAFTGGGAQIGTSFNRDRDWELSNFTTTSFGKQSQHSVKLGFKVEQDTTTDRSENNFGGTFTFPGFFGVDVADIDGDGVVSPIEQYRAKLQALPGTQYDPTQFTIAVGDPLVSVSQTNAALFVTDDWRISPALLLSFGLRYEIQNNISDNLNFAPRFGFAWSPGAGGAKAPKTVFRGGAGIFYDRFSDSLTLQARRFDGTRQLNLVVSANDPDPDRRAAALALLAQPIFTVTGVTNVPTAEEILAVLPQSNTIRSISDDVQAPYTFQAMVGMERQLPWKTTAAVFFVTARTMHQLRIRNINAPICPLQVNCEDAPRPFPEQGNLFQYETTGSNRQNQVIFNFRTNFNSRVSLFGNYRLGYAKSDTDGANSFPAYSYDFDGEFGRSSFDIRHNFIVAGNVSLPWNVSLNPFIIANSGRPFNITRGVDANADSLFTERPTFAQLGARCAELGLGDSFCDITGKDPNAIIPRNYGEGPKFFSVNLRVSKTFGFGKTAGQSASTTGDGAGPGGGGSARGGNRRGGGGGGAVVMRGGPGGGMFGGGDGRKPYNLNISVNFNNLFNNVNYGNPVGSLASSRFGQSTGISGGFGGFGGGGGGTANRRVELAMRFSF